MGLFPQPAPHPPNRSLEMDYHSVMTFDDLRIFQKLTPAHYLLYSMLPDKIE